MIVFTFRPDPSLHYTLLITSITKNKLIMYIDMIYPNVSLYTWYGCQLPWLFSMMSTYVNIPNVTSCPWHPMSNFSWRFLMVWSYLPLSSYISKLYTYYKGWIGSMYFQHALVSSMSNNLIISPNTSFHFHAKLIFINWS